MTHAARLPSGGVVLTAGRKAYRIATAIEPVFEMKQMAMIGHRFEPVVIDTTGNFALDTKALAALDWVDREQVDIANIEQGIELLRMRPPEQRKLLLIIPAAFSTFASTRARARIAPAVKRAIGEMGVKILFEIRQLAGVPQGRISEVVSLLKPYCMTTMGHASAEPRAVAALRGCGLAGACVDFDGIKGGEALLEEHLGALSSAAKASTGACMIQGFNNLQQMALGRLAGISHASIKASAMTVSHV